MRVKQICYDEIKNHFKYSEESPSGLIRLKCPNCKSKVGTATGSLNSRGYWTVYYNRKSYSAARVIYCLINGSIPVDKVIDHIDMNKTNNKIENLRLVSISENNCNKPINKSNKTGVTGVMYIEINNRCGKVNKYYRAVISDGTRNIVKSFNISTFGESAAFDMAVEYRRNKQESLVNYTKRHGT